MNIHFFYSKLSVLLLCLIACIVPLASNADTKTIKQHDSSNVLNIAFIELKSDPRYKKKRTFARFMGQAIGRPFAGAELALKEIKFHGAEIGISFDLQHSIARSAEELPTIISDLHTNGTRFFILDLPADILADLAKSQREKDLVLFNASAYETSLRQTQCQANLFHTLPSHAMLSDALGQYLISKKWRNILLLEGPLAEDKLLTSSFTASAKRYGLKILEKRSFILSNDPRERSKNNIALLTNGKHDVIYVADSQGEFARNAAYQTIKPNLIVGSEGLVSSAWHWAWDRHGAPQLEKRFEKKHKRPMANTDWAAWMAVKAIAGAVQSTKSVELDILKAHLTSPTNILDTFKGNGSNFRPWNNQLRQPILLTTHNWVVNRAPLKGFLHQTNNLDTLGIDQRNSTCKL
jgi:ABC transporter substrate binding protein (PQQ-dependent alcohol dehydrogenase system)